MKSIVSIMNGRGRGDGFDAEVFALASNEMNQPGGVSHVVVFEPVGGGTAFAQWADSEGEARTIAANGLPGDGFDWDEYQRLAAAAKGGRKAARSLGKSGRKERAAKAAAARWQRTPIGTIERFRELQAANGGVDAEGSFYALDAAKSKWLIVWHRGNRHDIWCYRIVNGEIAERASSKGPRMMRVYLGSPKLSPENVEWLLSLGI